MMHQSGLNESHRPCSKYKSRAFISAGETFTTKDPYSSPLCKYMLAFHREGAPWVRSVSSIKSGWLKHLKAVMSASEGTEETKAAQTGLFEVLQGMGLAQEHRRRLSTKAD